MLKRFKKVAVVAAMTIGVLGGVSSSAKAGGYVCVGGDLYESVGFWIFQFPVGQPLENASTCEGY